MGGRIGPWSRVGSLINVIVCSGGVALGASFVATGREGSSGFLTIAILLDLVFIGVAARAWFFPPTDSL